VAIPLQPGCKAMKSRVRVGRDHRTIPLSACSALTFWRQERLSSSPFFF
jgi:hypothetical protein